MTVDLPTPRVGPLAEHAPKPIRVVLNWGRRYSLWVFNFGLACCAIEFIATSMGRHDFIRLGVIPFAPGPRQADLMVVSGTVTDKMAPAIRRLYDQMPEPKYVISFGACANSGGPYWDSYCGHQGRRPGHPRRRLRAGLPATARGAAPGDHHPPGEDRRRAGLGRRDRRAAGRTVRGPPGRDGHRRHARPRGEAVSGRRPGPAHSPAALSTPALALLALVAFVTEIALFGGVGVVAHDVAGGGARGWGAAAAATLLALLLWGLFMAPKARLRLAQGPRTLAAIVLVYAVAFALLRTDHTVWAWIVGVAGLAVVAAQTVLHRPAAADDAAS